MSVPSPKKVFKLTKADFEEQPLWTWANEEDESLVIPLELGHKYFEDLKTDYESLFIRCQLKFRDGTEQIGVISFNLRAKIVYIVSFWTNEGNLFDLPLHQELRSIVNEETVVKGIGKSFDNLFPIVYSTPFYWDRNTPIKGTIHYSLLHNK